MSTTSQVTTGGTAIATVIASLLTASSPTTIWVMANQMQLFMLLLLTKSALPSNVVAFIMKSSYMSFNMDFLPLLDIPVISIPIKILDQDQKLSELNEIGIESGSAFVSNSGFLFTLLLVILAHLCLLLVPRKPAKDTEYMSKPKKCFYFVTRKLWEFFTFTLYIRLLLEAYQFMLLSSISEIYVFDISSSEKIASFIFACILALLCICIFLFVSIIPFFFSNTEYDELYKKKNIWDKLERFTEFYSGIKDTKFHKFYTPLLLLRRLVFVTWLIACGSFLNIVLSSCMFGLQVLYMIAIFKLRPYKDFTSNLIECLNEVFYTSLVGMLIYYNSTEKWTGTITNVYVYIMMANNLALLIIVTLNMIVTTIIKCVKKKTSQPVRVGQDPSEIRGSSTMVIDPTRSRTVNPNERSRTDISNASMNPSGIMKSTRPDANIQYRDDNLMPADIKTDMRYQIHLD